MEHIAAMTQKLGIRIWITLAPQVFGSSIRTFLIAIAAMFVTGLSGVCATMSDSALERLITREIAPMVDDVAGAAVAVRMDGRTTFVNYGMAERVKKRPVTSDTLFYIASMRKVFEATLLAEAVKLGELALSDRVVDYVPEYGKRVHQPRDAGAAGEPYFGAVAAHRPSALAGSPL
jgi:beta-lactamase class C